MSTANFLHFIDNRFVQSASERQFDKLSPVDGSLVGTVAEGGREEVELAVKAATAALQGPWGRLTLPQRTDMLYAVAREIDRRFEDFLDAEVNDTGKPRSVASHLDIPRGAANFRVFADAVRNVPTEFFEMTTPEGRKAYNYAVRVPKGVIAVVCPWNLPLLLMTWKVAPALACGNAVVVKPSEETPATATLLAEAMRDAGIPNGVYNVVHGFGPRSAGEFLAQHPDVDAVTFTGESKTGAAIMKAVAPTVKPVSFELGGKNAAIVFADCNFEEAVNGLSDAVFLNTGQVCLCAERVYVERRIFDEFVEALKQKAEGLHAGWPNDRETKLGPLISAQHREKVLSYYRLAREEGATVVTGGGVPIFDDDRDHGFYVQPTIYTGLPETARCVKEEIFGPVCHVTPVDSE